MYQSMSSPNRASLHLSIHLLIGVYSRIHWVRDRNTSFRRSGVHQRTHTATFGSSLMTQWSPLPNLRFYPSVVYSLHPPTSPFCCDVPPTQFTHSYWQWWIHRVFFCQVLIADLMRISVKGDKNRRIHPETARRPRTFLIYPTSIRIRGILPSACI